jgi:hypothetical protein
MLYRVERLGAEALAHPHAVEDTLLDVFHLQLFQFDSLFQTHIILSKGEM